MVARGRGRGESAGNIKPRIGIEMNIYFILMVKLSWWQGESEGGGKSADNTIPRIRNEVSIQSDGKGVLVAGGGGGGVR